MTTSAGTRNEPTTRSAKRGAFLVRRGALAGAVAAACTTAVAIIARAADIRLEVDGAGIPIAAFALWTIVATALGVGIALLVRERNRFVVVSVIALCLSLVPPIALPDNATATAVLVGAHFVAAAVIIPTLSRALSVGPVRDFSTGAAPHGSGDAAGVRTHEA